MGLFDLRASKDSRLLSSSHKMMEACWWTRPSLERSRIVKIKTASLKLSHKPSIFLIKSSIDCFKIARSCKLNTKKGERSSSRIPTAATSSHRLTLPSKQWAKACVDARDRALTCRIKPSNLTIYQMVEVSQHQAMLAIFPKTIAAMKSAKVPSKVDRSPNQIPWASKTC